MRQMFVLRPLAVTALGTCCLLATGCTGTGSDSHASGVVTGTLAEYGGPANPSTGKQSVNGAPVAGAVYLTPASPGARFVSETVSTDGRFVAHAIPGYYEVTGRAGPLTCSGGGVLVRPNKTVSVRVVCPVP